jgi:hypothetical protein
VNEHLHITADACTNITLGFNDDSVDVTHLVLMVYTEWYIRHMRGTYRETHHMLIHIMDIASLHTTYSRHVITFEDQRCGEVDTAKYCRARFFLNRNLV